MILATSSSWYTEARGRSFSNSHLPFEFPSSLLHTSSTSPKPIDEELTNPARHYWEVAVSCIMCPLPTEVPEKINATVELRVKVTNRNFTEDLNNISSHTYLNFVQLFKSQVRAEEA